MGLQVWGRRWLRIRIAVYAVVIAGLLLWRGGGPIRDRLDNLFRPASPAQFSITGMDLAAPLLTSLLDRYEGENAELTVLRVGGGTVTALDALLTGQTDIGLVCRLPSDSEQTLFEEATGDTLSCHRFALGALRLLGATSLGSEAVRPAELRELLTGRPTERFERLYTLDPNLGLWNVLHERLGIELSGTQRPPTVFFLPDARALRERLGTEPRALGIVSSLCDTAGRGGGGSVLLPCYDEASDSAIDPSDENVAAGTYPLYHYVYAATRSDVSPDGAKFVTHLVSDRGQRQVWRAGALPARITAREVFLSTRPLGALDR